jgi:hypothetical protein
VESQRWYAHARVQKGNGNAAESVRVRMEERWFARRGGGHGLIDQHGD